MKNGWNKAFSKEVCCDAMVQNIRQVSIRLACSLRERLFIGSPIPPTPVLTYPALKPRTGRRNQRGPGILFGSLRACYVHYMFQLSARVKSISPSTRVISLEQFTYIILQHEAIHLGEWSVYAALAGFETPLMWRLQWGL